MSSGKQASWISSAATLSTQALQYAWNSSVISVGVALALWDGAAAAVALCWIVGFGESEG